MARRRTVLPTGNPPGALIWFQADDWPGDSPLDAFVLWRSARAHWTAESPTGWPGGTLDRLRQERAVRRALHGWDTGPR